MRLLLSLLKFIKFLGVWMGIWFDPKSLSDNLCFMIPRQMDVGIIYPIYSSVVSHAMSPQYFRGERLKIIVFQESSSCMDYCKLESHGGCGWQQVLCFDKPRHISTHISPKTGKRVARLFFHNPNAMPQSQILPCGRWIALFVSKRHCSLISHFDLL